MQLNSCYVLWSDLNCAVNLNKSLLSHFCLSVFTSTNCSFHLYQWLKGKESESNTVISCLMYFDDEISNYLLKIPWRLVLAWEKSQRQ